MAFSTANLPEVDATLNAISACFLVAGWFFIRSGNKKAHAACMISAVTCSAVFLCTYLVHKYYHGTTRFTHPLWVRPWYLGILFTHLILAMVIVPLVIKTVYHASRRQWSRHMAIARYTLPIWLYVSVTGVLVYFFLYQWFPQVPR
jgi:uncharacterized membrane protein YozB (DUF420 family)